MYKDSAPKLTKPACYTVEVVDESCRRQGVALCPRHLLQTARALESLSKRVAAAAAEQREGRRG